MTVALRVLVAAIAALLIAISVQTIRLHRAQSEAGQLALDKENLKAAVDTSHLVLLSNAQQRAQLLGDSLQAVEREALQIQQHSDALDQALGLERKASAALRVQIKALITTASAPVVIDTAKDTRKASFAIAQQPYRGTIGVELPKTGNGTLDLKLSLDSAEIAMRLGCRAANAEGIKPAEVVAEGPKWLQINLSKVEQSPDVCRSPALEPKDSRSLARKLIDRLGISAGYGATASGGKWYAGPSALVGILVWP